VVDERLYRVGEGFPRISVGSMAQGVPPGVERIEYVINLEGSTDLVIARSPEELEGLQIPQWATQQVVPWPTRCPLTAFAQVRGLSRPCFASRGSAVRVR